LEEDDGRGGEGGGGGHSGGDAEHEGRISTAKPDPDLGFPNCPQEEEGRKGREGAAAQELVGTENLS
jgi:hypothetical protein